MTFYSKKTNKQLISEMNKMIPLQYFKLVSYSVSDLETIISKNVTTTEHVNVIYL